MIQRNEKMSRILICVDDTDDISKNTSTGKIAELIAKKLEDIGYHIIEGVTRHQLFLDDKIPYTSHNSSMCIEAEADSDKCEAVWSEAAEILKHHMAATADPGMAFCIKESLSDNQKQQLILFGNRAKTEVLSLEQTRNQAERMGVRLEAFGKNGYGQIGALAGIGLRLSGNDGTFRGKIKINNPGEIMLCKNLKKKYGIEKVYDENTNQVNENDKIRVNKQMKLSYISFEKVLVVKQLDKALWEPFENADLYEKTKCVSRIDGNRCEYFKEDNDREEQINQNQECSNCLFRRWTKDGMLCIKNRK